MDPELFQIRIGQSRQHREVDVVVGKCARVLLKPQQAQPSFNIHDRHRKPFPEAAFLVGPQRGLVLLAAQNVSVRLTRNQTN